MHFDAAPCIDIDAITLFVIFTDKEEYIAGTCRGSVTVTDNPLDIVTRWDEESRPCFQGFVSSLDDGQDFLVSLMLLHLRLISLSGLEHQPHPGDPSHSVHVVFFLQASATSCS